jgi:hypothetical protein
MVWAQGSFSRGIAVFLAGRRVGTAQNELNPRGESALVGTVELTAGRHTMQLERHAGSLAPGDGAAERLGPIVLQPASDSQPVQTLPSSRWRELCGRRLDWVEALR